MPENEEYTTQHTLENLYSDFSGSGKSKIIAELMLCIRSRLTEIAGFDPISGEALPSDMAAIINKILSLDNKEAVYRKDRVFCIIDHTSSSIRHIIKNTHSRIIRRHEIMPVYAVREMDSASIQWLAIKSGRTLREKLSGKPYMKAVIRKDSCDTAENRLFKAYLQKLDEILIIRKKILKDELDELEDVHLSIQRWMHNDVSMTIGPWINISPNNILLQDKNYRKIWDGWNLLQLLDDCIACDYKRMRQDFLTVLFWDILSQMNLIKAFRLLQMPVVINYNEYSFSDIDKTKGNPFSAKGFLLVDKNVKGSHISQYNSEFKISLKFDDKNPGLKITFISGSSIYLNYTQQGIRIIYKNKDVKIVPFGDFGQIKNISSDIITHIMGNKPQKITMSHTGPERENPKIENVAIDLYNVKPEYLTENYIKGRIPDALLLQYWNGGTVVDCGKATALQFDKGIKTLSIRNLFSNDEVFSQVEKNNAAMELSRRLKEYLKVNTLSYLIPDWATDFDLENIRRGMNFHFEEANSVPQSIAAVSYYFDALKKINRKYDIQSIFLVVDIAENKFAITPVTGNQLPELEKKVAETNGVCWERHPTISMDTGVKVNEDDLIYDLYKILGGEFISDQTNVFSIYKNNEWLHLPEEADMLLKERQRINLPDKEIIEETSKNERFKEQPVEYLVLDRNILCGNVKNNFISVENLLKGTVALSQRQKLAGDIPLWKDHLPELSIENNARKYNLVGKKTPPIVPKRNKGINIPVTGSVLLPAGAKDIRFNLIQGKGSNESKYIAFLESPAFPLKKEVECDLLLAYTYGDAKPYNLQFRPKDRVAAGFNLIEVQWRTKDELPEPELKTPVFPQLKTWEEFRKWPDKKGTGTSDLLKLCISKLKEIEKLTDIEHELEDMISKRKEGIYKKRKLKNDFFFVSINGDDVYCHKNQFCEPYDSTLCYEGNSFFMQVLQGEKGLYGINITYSDIAPDILKTEFIKNKIDHIFRPMHSIASIICNNGHSMTENDAPHELREQYYHSRDIMINLLKEEKTSQKLKNEIIFFFSCTHKDMPEEGIRKLKQFTENDKSFIQYSKQIAYAIGDASLKWQNILLKSVLNPKIKNVMMPISLRILSIAFWRNENLIFKINDNETGKILIELKRYFSENIKGKLISEQNCVILSRHLELLLALLRKRNAGNKLLYPESDDARWFIDKLNKIPQFLKNSGHDLRSYLEFNIEKPEKESGTPDIIYVLRQYLIGDNVNTIKISGVDFDDDNN